jgi:hypothetical protein
MKPIKILLEGDNFSNKMNLVGYSTQNHTLRTQPSVCQNHVATRVLLVLGTNTTCRHNFYTHMVVETTHKLSAWRGWGAVRPPPPDDQEIL